MCREYCCLFGVDRICNHCGVEGLIFAWETLEFYNKEKDDLGRGLVVRNKNFYCRVETPVIMPAPFLLPEP
eukprot:9663500-Heterocapsa_arctica.AAC.1